MVAKITLPVLHTNVRCEQQTFHLDTIGEPAIAVAARREVRLTLECLVPDGAADTVLKLLRQSMEVVLQEHDPAPMPNKIVAPNTDKDKPITAGRNTW